MKEITEQIKPPIQNTSNSDGVCFRLETESFSPELTCV